MVITIRFIDWVIFFFVFLCWGIDHWFTTYGLKLLTDCYKIELFSHTVLCVLTMIVFIASLYIIFKLFHHSFFLGISGLAYITFISITSYFWNSYLITNQILLAAIISLLGAIATLIGTVIISKINIKFFAAGIPLLIWRILLFVINITCLI